MSALVHCSIAFTRGPIARGSIQSVAIRVTGLAVSFVQAILAARILGPEGYGIAAVALSVVQIASTVAVFGYGRYAVREVARLGAAEKAASTARFVNYSARWVAALAVIAGCALSAAALAGLVPGHFQAAFLVSGLAVVPLALLQLQHGIAQGLGRIAAAQVPGEMLRPALFVAFLGLVVAAQIPLGPQGYVGAFAVAGLAALALSLPFTLRGLASVTGGVPDPAERRRWRTEATPFLGMALVAVVLGEIGTLLLGWFSGPREAGLFQPVARVVPLMVLPAQVVAVAFAPRVAELWSQGERARVKRLTHTFTIVTSAMTLGLVGLLILAAPLIMRAFGTEFLPGAALLWIVGLAQLINVAAGPVGHLLTMTGHAPVALRGQLAALIANLLVGISLIPSHGARGAAIAMAVGLAVWNLVLLMRVRKLLGFDPSLPAALMRVLVARI